jgi:RNA recognition motif. (a.k.a. RRM, RBD, or RNP domain)
MSVSANKTASWADDDDDSEPEPMVQAAAAAPPSPPTTAALRARGDSTADSIGSGGQRGGSTRSRDSGRPHGGGGDARGGGGLSDRPPYRAFVGNLNHSATEDDIGHFFHGLGCHVTDVHLSKAEDGAPKGFCHMEFGNRDSLRIALEQNNRQFMGRAIRLDIAEPRPGRASGGSRYGGGGGGGRYDEPRGGGGRSGGGYNDTRRGGDHHREQDPNFASFGSRGSREHRDDYYRGPPQERGPPQGGAGGGGGLGSGISAPSRPKLVLAPRTKPIEAEAAKSATDGAAAEPAARPASIFGAGKPQELSKYEVRQTVHTCTHAHRIRLPCVTACDAHDAVRNTVATAQRKQHLCMLKLRANRR